MRTNSGGLSSASLARWQQHRFASLTATADPVARRAPGRPPRRGRGVPRRVIDRARRIAGPASAAGEEVPDHARIPWQ